MSKLIPTNLKQIPEFLKQEDNDIRSDCIKATNKIHTIRLFDLYIKKLSREISETQLRIETLFPFITEEQRQKSIKLLLKTENNPKIIQKIDQESNNSMNFPSELKQGLIQNLKNMEAFKAVFKDQVLNLVEHKTQLQLLLRRANIARQAIPKLDSIEQSKLYPSMDSLYEEQARKRPWYHHGAFVFTLGLILLPVSPLIYYYLWKKPRDEESIQPNPFKEKHGVLRFTRKQFKSYAREIPDTDLSNRFMRKDSNYHDQYPSNRDIIFNSYCTKYKKERNTFFLNNSVRFFGTLKKPVTQQEAQWFLENKENDEMLHLSLGIK